MNSCELLNKENFKSFGDVIINDNCRSKLSINSGWTDRYDKISEYISKDNSKPIFSVFRGFKRPEPLKIKMMESHPLASQAFIPISKGDWLVVVCESLKGIPNINNIKCFFANETQGVNYYPGIWHHPLIVLNKSQDFLIVDRDNLNDKNNENLIEFKFSEIIINF